jgi:hypothetical protein
MKRTSITGVRLSTEDRKLIAALQKKMADLSIGDLVRLGLRALAAKEGIAA